MLYKLRGVSKLIMLLLISSVLLGIFSLGRAFADEPAASRRARIPIIMYHQVKPTGLGKDIISPAEFESDLKFLSENHYSPITMAQLIAFAYDGDALPENPVMLTFDDGYYNNYHYVYPLLQKYNAKIVLSIIGKACDDFSEYPSDNMDYAHATWDQIAEMEDSGLVELQNHTYNLHKMKTRMGCLKAGNESSDQYRQVLSEDIARLQNKLNDIVGVTPNTFNYPYGKYTPESEQIIKALGFKSTLTCDYGINTVTDDPQSLYGLKRICREHGVCISKILKDAAKMK